MQVEWQKLAQWHDLIVNEHVVTDFITKVCFSAGASASALYHVERPTPTETCRVNEFPHQTRFTLCLMVFRK